MPWVWQYCSAPKMYLCLHFLAYIGSLSGMSTLHSDFQQHLARPQLVYDQPHQKGSLTGLVDWLFNEPLCRGFLMFPSLSVVFLGGGNKRGSSIMLYRGCLRCNRVINLVALFPINYQHTLTTPLTNIELPQFVDLTNLLFVSTLQLSLNLNWFKLLVFSTREKIDPYFFLKMNHWCMKQILHLVPSKNLYICFCYISLHLPKIGQNLISAGHSDQYIALH